ncbi:MAG: hypothetical protein KDA21_08510 [Phycisphaerales bacterium]|nr:hypothetical protein [Phycisphaerales bacterium]
MPATRSRTENWRRSLSQLAERNGSLEFTLPGEITEGDDLASMADERSGNVIWRVRILAVSDTEIIVEQPVALGRTIPIEDGIDVVGIITIGQNRWMFKSRNLGLKTIQLSGGRETRGLNIEMPAHVERCQRRDFYRISTVGLSLPPVEMFPLLDPASAALAETANRIEILDALDQPIVEPEARVDGDRVMPEVGPPVSASLVNLGGGGAGLMLAPEDGGILEAHRLFWLRIGLQPEIPVAVAVTARVKHTHLDSSQRVYCGMAFDFGFNPRHEKFVVDQICRYVRQRQAALLRNRKTD